MQPIIKYTLGKLLNQVTRLLSNSPTARLDAEVLTSFVCQLSREQLITQDRSEISPAEYNHLQQLTARRQNGEPIAYITGEREFYSLTLAVNTHTLIPRPETECLVDLALKQIPENISMRIVDLGTGCGAIALAIAKNRPDCQIIATDYSDDALAMAKRNAENLSIANIEFCHGNWFAALNHTPVHLILSNPPYIAENDVHLSRGDVRFEPGSALIAGPDGLDDIKIIANHAQQYLLPEGILMIEHGAQQTKDINYIFSKAGGINISCHQDLAGLDRVSTCNF